MSIITWEEAYSVNVSQLDEQHRKLFGIINELNDSLASASVNQYANVALRTISEMREYTREHFSTEEEYMREIGYPGLADHKKLHDKFYVQIMNMEVEKRAGKMVLNTELLKTLANWLNDHTLSEDQKYRQFAASKGY